MGQEWSKKPYQRAGSGREALLGCQECLAVPPQGREWTGGHNSGQGVVNRPTGGPELVKRLTLLAGNGREALP